MHSMDIMTDEMGGREGGGKNVMLYIFKIYWDGWNQMKCIERSKHIHIVIKSGNAYAWNDTCSTVNSNDALWLQNEHLQFAVLSNHKFWRPRAPEMWPTVLQIHIRCPLTLTIYNASTDDLFYLGPHHI